MQTGVYTKIFPSFPRSNRTHSVYLNVVYAESVRGRYTRYLCARETSFRNILQRDVANDERRVTSNLEIIFITNGDTNKAIPRYRFYLLLLASYFVSFSLSPSLSVYLICGSVSCSSVLEYARTSSRTACHTQGTSHVLSVSGDKIRIRCDGETKLATKRLTSFSFFQPVVSRDFQVFSLSSRVYTYIYISVAVGR